jgi:hypothetical protein
VVVCETVAPLESEVVEVVCVTVPFGPCLLAVCVVVVPSASSWDVWVPPRSTTMSVL